MAVAHPILKSMLLWSVLGTFLSISLIVRENLIEYETAAEGTDSIYFVPKAYAIRPFLFGHEALLADLIWIRTLGYFADELRGNRRYAYLYDLLNLATDLDPRFEKVYMWAGAALMYNTSSITKEKVLSSTHFLEKGWNFIQSDRLGWRHQSDYWRIPQMIGFNYAMELKDKERGAPYIAATARIPGSPDLYKTWAATLYKGAGKLEKGARVLENMLSIEMLEGQIQSVKEDAVKQQIMLRLQMYYRKLYGEDAETRLLFFQERLNHLISEWRQTLPFASFTLFMLLNVSEADLIERRELDAVWQSLFPLLQPFPA